MTFCVLIGSWQDVSDSALFVFLPVRYNITGIVAQGRGDAELWTTRLQVNYTQDGVTWLEHYKADGITPLVRYDDVTVTMRMLSSSTDDL